MPLVQGSSRDAVSENISRERAAGKKPSQAIAIALDVARKNRAAGGQLSTPWFVRNEARGMMHQGPISSVVPGRTDNHGMKVAAGSYVLPADHVSSLGQGNTSAGMAVLGHMFGGQSPYGGKSMGIKHGSGAPRPPKAAKFADGGDVDGDPAPVDIMAAGGEYVIPPEIVQQIGGGDMARGHEILDHWVVSSRKQHVKTLRKLPGPAKD